jgi:hypothetical protein
MTPRSRFVRVALVLPTEFAYAREVLHGIIAATRERNMYDSHHAARPARGKRRPWQFRVLRGIYTSSRFLARWFRDWNPDGIICQIQEDPMVRFYRDMGKPVVEVFERNGPAEFRGFFRRQATGKLARAFLHRGFRHFAFFGEASLVAGGGIGFKRRSARLAARSHISADRPFTFNSYESGGRSVGDGWAGHRIGGNRRRWAIGWLRCSSRSRCWREMIRFELVQARRTVCCAG